MEHDITETREFQNVFECKEVAKFKKKPVSVTFRLRIVQALVSEEVSDEIESN